MPIELKCSNAGCTTVMAVKEEHAGRQVKCPSCGTVTVVPSAGSPASPTVPAPPAESAPVAGGSPMEMFQSLCQVHELDETARYVLLGGLGALVLLAFSLLFLPRATSDLKTTWWIATIVGAPLFLATIGVAAFLAAAFVKMHVFFQNSLFAAAGWGAIVFMLIFLCMLAEENSIGVGSYLGILAALGVAGTFGYLSYLRIMKQQQPTSPV